MAGLSGQSISIHPSIHLSIYRSDLSACVQIHTDTHIYVCIHHICIYMFLFFIFIILKILFIYFLEREKGKEKERGRNINVWLPLVHPALGTRPATQARAPTGNRTFGLQACAQSTELHQPGYVHIYIYLFFGRETSIFCSTYL